MPVPSFENALLVFAIPRRFPGVSSSRETTHTETRHRKVPGVSASTDPVARTSLGTFQSTLAHHFFGSVRSLIKTAAIPPPNTAFALVCVATFKDWNSFDIAEQIGVLRGRREQAEETSRFRSEIRRLRTWEHGVFFAGRYCKTSWVFPQLNLV